jgi:hypothetical protein
VPRAKTLLKLHEAEALGLRGGTRSFASARWRENKYQAFHRKSTVKIQLHTRVRLCHVEWTLHPFEPKVGFVERLHKTPEHLVHSSLLVLKGLFLCLYEWSDLSVGKLLLLDVVMTMEIQLDDLIHRLFLHQ